MGTPPTDIAASKEFSIATCWSSLNQKLHLLSSNIKPKFMMHFKRVKLLQSSLNQELQLLNNDLHILKFDSGRYPKCQLLMFITKKTKKQTLPNSPETYSFQVPSKKTTRTPGNFPEFRSKDHRVPIKISNAHWNCSTPQATWRVGVNKKSWLNQPNFETTGKTWASTGDDLKKWKAQESGEFWSSAAL